MGKGPGVGGPLCKNQETHTQQLSSHMGLSEKLSCPERALKVMELP